MSDDNSSGLCGFFGCIFWLIVSFTLGAWSIIYCVSTLFHQHIAYGWAVLISFFTGWFSVILAVILWLLQLAGVRI
jgi:hypothetical protein